MWLSAWLSDVSPTVLPDPTTTFLQYGVTGAVAVMFIGFAYALFKRLDKSHERERQHLIDELEDANKRADAGVEEIRKLNDAFREKYSTVLGESMRAVSDALDMVRQLKRGGE